MLEIELLDADRQPMGSFWPIRKPFDFAEGTRSMRAAWKCSLPAKPGDYVLSLRVDRHELATYECRVHLER
jgi:hypothetical protein